MAEARIEPHKITRFVQLPAVWIAGLVALALIFGSLAATSDETWMRATFTGAAILVVIAFGCIAFLLQTKYRPHIQEDAYYSEYLNNQFKGFRAENLREGSPAPGQSEESWEQLENERIKTYEDKHGLFIVHDWRKSREPGQVADIAIRLHQHGEGPLTKGEVKSVEYHLGPKFFAYPVVETDPTDGFRLDVSAYGPMLCLARVHFADGRRPLHLERYVDFDISLAEQAA